MSEEKSSIQPFPEAPYWVEVQTSDVAADVATTTLMVRLGMASNLMVSEQQVLISIRQSSGYGAHFRDLLSALIIFNALVHETLMTVKSALRNLRPLAVAGEASEELLQRIGRLCAGHHPASSLLDRARNELGFHWNPELVASTLSTYLDRTYQIVWLESDRSGQPIQRLSLDTVLFALFPRLYEASNSDDIQSTIGDAVDHMIDASTLLDQFILASMKGYLGSRGRWKRSERHTT